MIFELIGTWIVVGFFSAIGWGTAQKTIIEPYMNPAIEKAMPAKIEEKKDGNSNNH